MLMLATRIFLAVLLTISSPAWCACALAATASDNGSAASVDGCSDWCCPASQERLPCFENNARAAEEHHPAEGGLPCRDQSDCSCCDAGTLQPASASREIGVPKPLLRGDLIPLPLSLLSAASIPARSDAPPIEFAARGSTPLTAATPLLLRGCLLLT